MELIFAEAPGGGIKKTIMVQPCLKMENKLVVLRFD